MTRWLWAKKKMGHIFTTLTKKENKVDFRPWFHLDTKMYSNLPASIWNSMTLITLVWISNQSIYSRICQAIAAFCFSLNLRTYLRLKPVFGIPLARSDSFLPFLVFEYFHVKWWGHLLKRFEPSKITSTQYEVCKLI